jgi:hypothetical protein
MEVSRLRILVFGRLNWGFQFSIVRIDQKILDEKFEKTGGEYDFHTRGMN